jgi:starch-binding outer membrane protein, SusD/RagB family
MKKMSFKNIKIGIAAFVLAGITSACDVTDLSPANLIPDEESFGTAARVESLVLGVYESAQQGFYLGLAGQNGRGYPFGAANVQQGDMRGEDMFNDQLFYEITYIAAHTPFSANNNGMWISIYRMVNRANIVLESLDEALARGIITQEVRNTLRGEMLFLRALGHHELLTHFSRPFMGDPSALGVPYRRVAINDVPLVAANEALGRTTVAEDYALLLEDLNEAEELLPMTRNHARVRKGAAIALKSRVLLHMGNWQAVLDEYAKLTGTYSLMDSPTTPFRTVNSSENIFSFVHTPESNAGVNGALPSMYGNPGRGARGLVKISPLIWRADFWHPEDKRRTELTDSNSGGIYTFKYTDVINRTDPNPILRYAESVLNAAEANARLGNSAAAVQLLNSVRDRALPASVPSFTTADFPTIEALLTAIFNERRIEFLAEGRRWADIHRLSGEGLMSGIPVKATSRSITSLDFYTTDREIPTDHALAYTSNLFVWPIPIDEIVNNSGNPIPQNPGY